METRQPATDFKHALADDLANIEAVIVAMEAKLATCEAKDLVAVIGAIEKARYFRRNIFRRMEKPDLAEEPEQARPADLQDRRARGRALAEGLTQPAS